MKIGIVQPVIGSIGGNDKVLDAMIKALDGNKVNIFTFSKPNKTFPDYVTVKVAIPKHIPLFGVYQRFVMPNYDYSKCDIVISATGYNVKTKKPLIIYDQNNIANDFNNVTPLKYQKGLWRLYYLPYKILCSGIKKNEHAYYVANSEYSSRNLCKLFHVSHIDVLYPAVDLKEFYSVTKKPQICVISRITPEKNLERTVSILNQTRYPCVIFGNVTKINQNFYKKLKRMCKSNVIILNDLSREKLIYLLAESRIIFTTSSETFGITTIEGIASHCIPIVPDNSAHPELVPFKELRFTTNNEAIKIINKAMEGTFASYFDVLSGSIEQYSHEKFKTKFLYLINNVIKQCLKK